MSAPPQSAPTRDTLAGTVIGPYEVLSRLALGGMAELLLARRVGIEGFQKLVVLKRILPQYATNPDFVDMFLHEARLAAALEHPNIVQVFDIGKSGDDYYFAMAYLHGKDVLAILRELTRAKIPMPIEHAVAIASGVAAGLHHAHEQIGFDGLPLGIVHRDVSPANAIVTFDGTVKLVDFGIAKAAAQMNQTRAGVRKGKAAYMSPEQCRGEPLDRRTDVWSLGVMLYEMLTMMRLFKADNDLAMMHRITSYDVPSVRTVNPAVSPALDAVLMRCLQRDRERRYATCAELQRDLDASAAAVGLRQSASALALFVRELFGNPPLPWTPTASIPTPSSASADAPITHSVEVAADAFSPASGPADSTRDLGHTPPPQAQTSVAAPIAGAGMAAAGVSGPHFAEPATPRLARPTTARPGDDTTVTDASERRGAGRGPVVAAIVAVLAVGIGVAAWMSWPRDAVRAPEGSAGAAPEPIAAASPVAPSDATAEHDRWLATVNDPDATRNAITKRQPLVAKLRDAGLSHRIDTDLHVRLDLRQAAEAERPCETFATALERAAAARERFADDIANATPPDRTTSPRAGQPPDRTCDDLGARLASLRSPIDVATPDAIAEGPNKSRPRRTDGKPTTAKPTGSKPTGSKPTASKPDPDPTPAGGKIDDELRPFRR
jgi:serine/threonine protein kinase